MSCENLVTRYTATQDGWEDSDKDVAYLCGYCQVIVCWEIVYDSDSLGVSHVLLN